MTKTLLILLAALIVNIAKAQEISDNQKNAATYVLQNLKFKNEAIRYLTDVVRPYDTLTLSCLVKLNSNGVVEDVKVTNGLDEMFDESIRKTLFLMPKGVCTPPTNNNDNYLNLFFKVYIDEIRDIQIARDIELFYNRKKFVRVDIENTELLRFNPAIYDLYKSTPTVNSSLWIIRMRATNVRFFSPMVK